MKRVHEVWFECEDGHITVGGTKKTVCDANLWQLNYVKGKRKQWTLEKKAIEKKCGKHIIASGEIPEKLDYTKVWDHKTAHAFSIGQALDADFLVGLQEEITSLWKKIGEKNEP